MENRGAALVTPIDKTIEEVIVKTPSKTGSVSYIFYSGNPHLQNPQDNKFEATIENVDDQGELVSIQYEDESILTAAEVARLEAIAARLRGKSDGRYGK